MADIMKFIVNKESADEDTQGNLMDLGEWNETIGLSLARQEGIEMTDAHWEVVSFLRKYYMEHGETPYARKLTEILEKECAVKGGRKYLYRLFPKGPVTQASRIAGLPVPQHSVDPSFGSSQ
ncbi:MAG: TusE/DsrC/DsvC family sulfur relay protein [Gammaproteobacteria bacterium]|nr:TusE/DsrC/DsvC family sulfur relay protein [Gammaproteobacteria bacterium]